MKHDQPSNQTTLLHRWKIIEGVECCCQCGKPKSDMERGWPHDMMVCPVNFVRPEFKVEFCYAV